MHFLKSAARNIVCDSMICVGRVLNRFSKDVGFLDDIIPPPFFDYLSVSITYAALCSSMLVITITHCFFTIPAS